MSITYQSIASALDGILPHQLSSMVIGRMYDDCSAACGRNRGQDHI